MRTIRQRLMHFLRASETGVALIEFAVTLPVLLVMLVGMIELTYVTLVNQKLDKVAGSMSDFATQGRTISVSDINAFALAVPQIMRPFTFSGTVVFSSVANFRNPSPPCLTTNVPCIAWQRAILGGDGSRIGGAGGIATLPDNYPVLTGQNVIVAEVFHNYTPLLGTSASFIAAFSAQQFYKVAISKPRQGTLTTLLP
jgi:hypothetical protein